MKVKISRCARNDIPTVLRSLREIQPLISENVYLVKRVSNPLYDAKDEKRISNPLCVPDNTPWGGKKYLLARGAEKMKALTIKFEGAEKKLEVILSSPQANLRSNADKRWNRVVEASRALILSHVATESLDAYLLSESSLFVWEDRILMITCGKTTLVKALPEILNIVGKENVAHLFYEQKDFLFPDKQPSNFETDAAFIKAYCPGKTYSFGAPSRDHVNVFYWSRQHVESEPDVTLEILMNDPAPSVMEFFSEKNSGTADRAESRSGLKNILQQRMLTDGYLFSPHGYSLNGVLHDNYVTVHVTPQPENAYTSFETNMIEKDYAGMVNKVVSVFRPERFTVVLTKNTDIADPTLTDSVPGYLLAEKSTESLDRRYAVNFMNYRRCLL